ncbi:hypothetical protein LMIY3S_00017 [Labrys miyagiensis]
MSGPKVVRIVTREEIEAICLRHIRVFDEAAAFLVARANRCDFDVAALTIDIGRKREHLKTLLETERWTDLQKQAPIFVAFLKSETETIRTRAVAAAESRRSKRRVTIDTARSMVKALEDAKQPVSEALRQIVSHGDICSEKELIAMQDVLADSFGSLARLRATPASPDLQTPLAHRLAEGETPQSLAEWVSRQPIAKNGSDKRLDALLAEIEVSEPPEIVKQFLDRARTISSEASSAQRALLTDSLILDASDRAQRRKTHEAILPKLLEARAAIAEIYSAEANALKARLDRAAAEPGTESADEIIQTANALADAALNELAEAARRQAVLTGLAELGYEISENMATAWASNGRIVVRKPETDDYGIELAAPGSASQMQVRLVGSDSPSSSRTKAKDLDQETSWCSEFGRLQALLAKDGSMLEIKRALGVGAEPVKSVDLNAIRGDVREELARPTLSRATPT